MPCFAIEVSPIGSNCHLVFSLIHFDMHIFRVGLFFLRSGSIARTWRTDIIQIHCAPIGNRRTGWRREIMHWRSSQLTSTLDGFQRWYFRCGRWWWSCRLRTGWRCTCAGYCTELVANKEEITWEYIKINMSKFEIECIPLFLSPSNRMWSSREGRKMHPRQRSQKCDPQIQWWNYTRPAASLLNNEIKI